MILIVIVHKQVRLKILIFLCFVPTDISEFDLLLMIKQAEVHLCLHIDHGGRIDFVNKLFYWLSEQGILRCFIPIDTQSKYKYENHHHHTEIRLKFSIFWQEILLTCSHVCRKVHPHRGSSRCRSPQCPRGCSLSRKSFTIEVSC